jgi:flavodoxin
MAVALAYFSRTGNTRKLAQAIADVAGASLFDVAATPPSEVKGFDLLIVGTPVEGARPTKEVRAFIDG